MGGEAATIPERIGLNEHARQSYAALVAALELTSDPLEKKAVLQRTGIMLSSLAKTTEPMKALLVADLLLRYADNLLLFMDEAIFFNEAKGRVMAAISLLSLVNARCPEISRFVQSTLPDSDVHITSWKTLAPRIEVDLRVICGRLNVLTAVPFKVTDLQDFAQEYSTQRNKAKQRNLLMEAVSASQLAYESDPTSGNSTALERTENICLEFEYTEPKDLLFLASNLLRLLSGHRRNLQSWQDTYRYCYEFLEDHERFDIPTVRAGLIRLLLESARRLSRSPSVTKYAGMLATEGSNSPKQPSTDRHGLLQYMEIIHPLNQQQQVDFGKMFRNCVELIYTWLLDEQDAEPQTAPAEEPAAQPRVAGVDDHGDYYDVDELIASLPRDEEDIAAVLGSKGTGPSRFQLTSTSAWQQWLMPIQRWLLQPDGRPSSHVRQYVLKCLVTVRTFFATESCMMINDLPPYTTVLARAEAERGRALVYDSISPSVLGPGDRRMARAGYINTDLSLTWFDEAFEAGDINDEILRNAQERNDVLTDEYHGVNSFPQEYGALCTGGRLRWQRYSKRSYKETFEPLERADRLASDMRQRQNTVASSQQPHQPNKTSFIARIAAGQNAGLTDHIFVALSSSIEDVQKNFQKLQKALREGKTERQATISALLYDAKAYMFTWSQRSKSRTLRETVSSSVELPKHAAAQIRSSETAQQLLAFEANLVGQYSTSISPPDKLRIKDALDVCRGHMRAEPALTGLISLRDATPLSLTELQKQLDSIADTLGQPVVFVDYFHAEHPSTTSDLWLFICRSYSDPKLRNAEGLSMHACDYWCSRTVAAQYPFADNSSAFMALTELSSLVRPFWELTMPGETIILCASKGLHNVPFHALKIDGEFFIERNPLVYCQSAALAAHCLEDAMTLVPGSPKASVIHGLTSDYPATADGSRVRLADDSTRRSTRTATSLASTLKTEVLRDGALNSQSLRDHLADTTLLHWHGHAHFNRAAPIDSGLVLTDPPPSIAVLNEGAAAHGLLFTAQDVLDTRLGRPALALILGCQSGVSEVTMGGDVVGLNAALHYAGATSIISASWSIDDDDAAEYSEAFFAALDEERDTAKLMDDPQVGVAEGTSKVSSDMVNLAVVNQQAMLKLMQDYKPSRGSGSISYKAPYHWAAFTLNGSFLYPRSLLISPGEAIDPAVKDD